MSLPVLKHHRYLPYGSCIYCGEADDLREEHIVPFGLDGNLKLPQSTCRECADITSKIEMDVLRGELWAVRVYRELQSRRKHNVAPKKFPVKISCSGVEREILLSIEDYPILLHFPVFTKPGVILSLPEKPGVSVVGVDTISFGRNPKEILMEYGADSIYCSTTHHPVEFARMIAKIAYSMAAATGALNLLKSASPIPSVILGHTAAVGHWVGSIDSRNIKYPGVLHRVEVVPDEEQGVLVGNVQLFCDSFAPCYSVIIGDI